MQDDNNSEAMRNPLHQAKLWEAKLIALQEHVTHAVARGGSYTDEEIEAILRQ